MDHVVMLQQPEKVNIIEWSLQHPNCDALIKSNKGAADIVYIVAYATDRAGNQRLKQMSTEDKTYGLFTGIDASMLNYMGGIR